MNDVFTTYVKSEKETTILGKIVFVHYVVVPKMELTNRYKIIQVLAEYKAYIEKLLPYEDVINIYVPVDNQPAKIEKLL